MLKSKLARSVLCVFLVLVIGFTFTVIFGTIEQARFRSSVRNILANPDDVVLLHDRVDNGRYSGLTRLSCYAIIRFSDFQDGVRYQKNLESKRHFSLSVSYSPLVRMQFLDERGAEHPMYITFVQVSKLRSVSWYDYGQWLD